jgi:hypothetical protein
MSRGNRHDVKEGQHGIVFVNLESRLDAFNDLTEEAMGIIRSALMDRRRVCRFCALSERFNLMRCHFQREWLWARRRQALAVKSVLLSRFQQASNKLAKESQLSKTRRQRRDNNGTVTELPYDHL